MGYLNGGKGNKEEVIREFARLLNVKLGDNFWSNLDKQKNVINHDIDKLEFFKEMLSSYQQFIEKPTKTREN